MGRVEPIDQSEVKQTKAEIFVAGAISCETSVRVKGCNTVNCVLQ